MRIILTVLSLLFFNCSVFAAEAYSNNECAHTIMSIDSFEVSDAKTTILLNNGTIWLYKDVDLFADEQSWKIGDRINIVYAASEGYFLQNISYQGSAPVKLIDYNSDNALTTRISQIIENKKKGTNIIVLDDATRWFVGSWSSHFMKKWKVGDRVIVTPQEFVLGDADHLLINFDQDEGSLLSTNVRAQYLFSTKKICTEDQNKREPKSWKTFVENYWLEGNHLMVELSNKTRWQCSMPENLWNIGDDVMVKVTDGNFKLKNLNDQSEVDASFTNQSSKEIVCPVIKQILQKGKKVVLSDGTIWIPNYSSLNKWKVGDRLLVVANDGVALDSSTHKLINLELRHNLPLYSTVTLIH